MIVSQSVTSLHLCHTIHFGIFTGNLEMETDLFFLKKPIQKVVYVYFQERMYNYTYFTKDFSIHFMKI